MKVRATAVLTVLGCLAACPLLCVGLSDAENVCADQLGFPTAPNSFLAYITNITFDPLSGGNVCSGVELNCNASVDPLKTRALSSHTWFLEPIHRGFGQSYPPRLVQRYRIQCPMNHLLHLYMQDLNAPNADTVACSAGSGDFVTVSDGVFNFTMCNNDTDPDFQNDGLGTITTNPVDVEFCSDGSNQGRGFVLRATCLEPRLWRCTGCNDYFFYKAWDPEFVDRINEELPDPNVTTIEHKRSTENLEVESSNKMPWPLLRLLHGDPATQRKRFVTQLQRFEVLDLLDDDKVIYQNNTVTVMRGEFMDVDPDEVFDDIQCFSAFNDLVRTRNFFQTATTDLVEHEPLRFCGPGTLSIVGSKAYLRYSIPDPSFFLSNPEVAAAVNRLYDYIYRNFKVPYPLIDDKFESFVFPPADVDRESIPAAVKRYDTSGVVFADAEEGNICRRIIVLGWAPMASFRIPDSHNRFCRFFFNACDVNLRTACRNFLALEGIQSPG